MENTSYLSTLSVEVLVHIVSFLPTREKIRIRCVSKTLRSISEVPSLWEDFIWSRYAPRDEKLLKHVLKIVGKYVKRIHFADHIAPSKLEAILKSCRNVLHLSLPSIHCRNFEKLIKIVHSMVNIQISLCIQMPEDYQALERSFQLCFKLFGNCKEVSVHCRFTVWNGMNSLPWLEEWANCNYMPRTLNIVVTQFYTVRSLTSCLCACVPMLRGKPLQKISDIDHSACFNIYLNKGSTDFLEAAPYAHLKITDSSVIFSSVKASKYGILGLDNDALLLTQGRHRGKQIWKALLTKANIEYIDTSIISLTFVTFFDASRYGGLYPGHLEQLSIACPKLQFLDLSGNSVCLSNLQGLQSLADNCKGLQGLSLQRIHILDHECSCIDLWEILCTLNLSQLSIESWMMKICDSSNAESSSVISGGGESSRAVMRQKLNQMVQRYSSLKILEVGVEAKYMLPFTQPCYNLSDNELSVITSFPSITCYRLCNLPPNNCYHTLKQIFNQKYLRRLFLCKTSLGILSLPIESRCPNLQELCIQAVETVPTETFIDALCGSVGLECVIFHVKSLSARNIESMVEHLSNLVTFLIYLYSRAFLKSQLKQLKAAITTKFPKRRLFNGGNFDIHVSCYLPHKNSVDYNKNLLSAWDSLT